LLSSLFTDIGTRTSADGAVDPATSLSKKRELKNVAAWAITGPNDPSSDSDVYDAHASSVGVQDGSGSLEDGSGSLGFVGSVCGSFLVGLLPISFEADSV
jgi:hypothetical protein